MPAIPLPEDPSLDHLKNQAKLVRDLVRSGDEGALNLIDEFHPRLDAEQLTAPDQAAGFKLSDAQLTVSRLYGFDSWTKLRAYLETIEGLSHRPLAEQGVDVGDEPFVSVACLNYAEQGPSPADRLELAHAMLASDPTLAEGTIEALAAVGDHVRLAAALDAELDRQPELVNKSCGPNDWPPLLYAVYSRIDPARFASHPTLAQSAEQWSTIETVQALLDRGADPNAGFLWRGLVPPFTALTGAFGGGESHQSWHGDRLELARLLLDAGADPNDGQGLYNNGIGGQNHDDPSMLELLVEYGLGTAQNGPWYQQLGNRLREPAELLYDEVEAAARRGRPGIMSFLAGLGLNLDRPVGRSQMTPVRIAAEEGHQEVLDVLASAGVDISINPAERFLSLVRSGDVAAVEAHVGQHSGLVDQMLGRYPSIIGTVTAEHEDMLVWLIETGFDINARDDGVNTALHSAAHDNNLPLAQLLIRHGADPNLKDTMFDATPWGWANHFGQTDVAEYLRPLTADSGGDSHATD